ncbi:hypothetical protein Mext_0540 [Methylorubrum extorquens PA1]|nr:hypothetical protein Mext_0540 [Methylorubrum extorquens PA1]
MSSGSATTGRRGSTSSSGWPQSGNCARNAAARRMRWSRIARRHNRRTREMASLFKELDYRPTRLGALSLRRRRDLVTGADVHEILLGDAYLMSSRFTP